MTRSTNTLEDGINFRHHVVAVIDFLGQSSELAKLDFLPQSPEQMEPFVEAARRTFGRVMTWRNRFEKWLRIWNDSRDLTPEFAAQLPDGGKTFREFARTDVAFAHFSDSLIAYSPLENTNGVHNMGCVGGFLHTAGMMMLTALAEKTVLRGGIDIGVAGNFPQAELYGPALAKAHHLESKVAKYPRLIVGQSLVDYLQAHSGNLEDTPQSRANRSVAAWARSLLSTDNDEHIIVDYLGSGFTEIGPNPQDLTELRRRAFAFATAEFKRFQCEGDEKLTERYERLVSYFDSRNAQN